MHPELAFASQPLKQILGSAAPSFPITQAKKGRTAQGLQHETTHRGRGGRNHAVAMLNHGSGVWRRGESARGEIAIPGRGDHTRNMFGTSLHTTYCK